MDPESSGVWMPNGNKTTSSPWKSQRSNFLYPLVVPNIAIAGRSPFSIGSIHLQSGPFSIASHVSLPGCRLIYEPSFFFFKYRVKRHHPKGTTVIKKCWLTCRIHPILPTSMAAREEVASWRYFTRFFCYTLNEVGGCICEIVKTGYDSTYLLVCEASTLHHVTKNLQEPLQVETFPKEWLAYTITCVNHKPDKFCHTLTR